MDAVALVLLLLVVLAIVAFIATARRGASDRVNDPAESMDAESRTLYRPISRLVSEIEELGSRTDSMVVRVVGAEAVQEAQRIRDQIARALNARTDLKRAARGEGLAQNEIANLDKQAEDAQSDGERQALENAKEARSLELSHYGRVREAITKIDLGVRQAEAVLSEMKTRLLVSASHEKAETAGEDDLRETIGRLKTLSVSYEEAEQSLRTGF